MTENEQVLDCEMITKYNSTVLNIVIFVLFIYAKILIKYDFRYTYIYLCYKRGVCRPLVRRELILPRIIHTPS